MTKYKCTIPQNVMSWCKNVGPRSLVWTTSFKDFVFILRITSVIYTDNQHSSLELYNKESIMWDICLPSVWLRYQDETFWFRVVRALPRGGASHGSRASDGTTPVLHNHQLSMYNQKTVTSSTWALTYCDGHSEYDGHRFWCYITQVYVDLGCSFPIKRP